MKILTMIPSMSANSNPYLPKVLKELKDISDVYVFAPEKIEMDGVNTQLSDPNLKHALTFEHRRMVVDLIDEYDYFLYNEDDILITRETLEYAIEVNEKISKDDPQNNVQFLRYEVENEVEEFVDLAPYNSVHRGGNGVSDIIQKLHMIDGDYYFIPYNLHSGNWLLSKYQVKVLMHNNVFHTNAEARYCGVLESAASDIKMNLRMLSPTVDYKKLMVHHMPNKYVFNPVKVSTQLLDNFFSFIPEDVAL